MNRLLIFCSFLISISSLHAQINQGDTSICVGSSIILSADSATCYNQIFNQTQNVNTGWTIGPNVNMNETYSVTVYGTYSMWGNCTNPLDAAYQITNTCGLVNCTAYNGSPGSGYWYIQNYVGIRPDVDVCGGNNGLYEYTIIANSNQLQFTFYDNAYGDNSGSLTFVVEEVLPDSVIWSTGSNSHSIVVSPPTTTTYYCTRYYCNQAIEDSVTIEVLQNTSSTQLETALDSYTWPVNNQTYTQSGTYTAVIPNAAGCDSTITLELTMQFTGINEPTNTPKELIKIIDFMGRETPFKPNTPLIFIYSDGTRERVMEIEE